MGNPDPGAHRGEHRGSPGGRSRVGAVVRLGRRGERRGPSRAGGRARGDPPRRTHAPAGPGSRDRGTVGAALGEGKDGTADRLPTGGGGGRRRDPPSAFRLAPGWADEGTRGDPG